MHLRSLFLCAVASAAAALGRETRPLDADWRFHLGDVAGAEQGAYDDAAWRVLDVPHDWAWEAPYTADAAQGAQGGYKPGGIGWYRRVIDVPADWTGEQVWLEFDGVYMDSTVWLNGTPLGRHHYGYGSFGYELTPQLKPGRNVLAVRVDNSVEPSARWYHGCGIYAPVKLVVADSVHVARDGISVTTPRIDAKSAEVQIEAVLAGAASDALKVAFEIVSPEGASVARAEASVSAGRAATSLRVPQPRRWDVATPALYTAVVSVRRDGRTLDEVRTRFGIRDVRWDRDTGFWLNGRNLKLQGVADHLEAGPVGAASTEALLRWRLELLRSMGVNAIRTAHNPQVPRFYELCDELGLLVLDEIFDGWSRKAANDYGARFFASDWERDLRDWIRRDRNHPCVIAYSVGNETKGAVAADLVRVCHEEDATRLVTSGSAAPEAMDIEGMNGPSEAQNFLTHPRPGKPFFKSEAPHTWQVRGFYRTRTWYRDGLGNRNRAPFPIADLASPEVFTYDWAPSPKSNPKQVFNSSYDNATVRISARRDWEMVRDTPWIAGHFRWSGFDYVGEAEYVHGGWPFRAFMGGALDLAGFKKDLFYFYQSQWTEAPMVHLLPSWTHPRMTAGTGIPVWAYSNAEEIELWLNGRSLGRQRPGRSADQMQCQWVVPWQPGTLEAVAYRGGREVARDRQTTAGAPAALRVATSTTTLAADGQDVAIVDVAQTDAAGTFYPYGENAVEFSLDGPAEIMALENGNPVDTTANYGVTMRRTFFGLTRAFVRATRAPGDVSLVVGAINGERRQLTSDQVTIDVHRVALRGAAAVGEWQITYTLDGTEPTERSARYSGAFAVKLGTTVRALVRQNGHHVMTLTETFGADAGLYWPAAKAP